jgi:biotin-dependent carboxylase-like uncharacterized protein
VRALTIRDAGPLTTVQDGGRSGWAHLGVPRAGALDRPAADLANRLVGNHSSAAVLETTLAGVTFTVSDAMTVAVTGAEADVSVDDRPAAFGEPVGVRAGSAVRVGAAWRGVRSYVAVAGGVEVAEVLGSRSTDTLAWVGPALVRDGDVLPVGARVGEPAGVDLGPVRRFSRPAVLGVRPGPRLDWFSGDALTTLTTSSYVVTGDSNRIGLRLDGPAITRRRDDELPSEGMVLGAVQVPPSGRPLVFLHDHPTTGGYPVLGVVDRDDLWQCAQLRPGEGVRFTLR